MAGDCAITQRFLLYRFEIFDIIHTLMFSNSFVLSEVSLCVIEFGFELV